MDEAERIAREAHGTEFEGGWGIDSCIQRAIYAAARLGIEHGERASAEKIADMKATLEWYRLAFGLDSRAAQCLARNFPPKPSLREAAQVLLDRAKRPIAHLPSAYTISLSPSEFSDFRDALAREEGR